MPHLPKNAFKGAGPELDIAEELTELMDGSDFSVEHSAPFIHRKIRRQNTFDRVKCNCWIKESGEGRLGCGDCEGVGYLWDESVIKGFMYFLTTKSIIRGYEYAENAGREESNKLALITQPNVIVLKGDYISSPLQTETGTFQWPLAIEEEYFVINYKKYRLDRGKLEYNLSILTRVK